MSISINDLERTVNSGLTTSIKASKIHLGQLFIDVDVKDLTSVILFLKTNDKCSFRAAGPHRKEN